MDHTAFRHVRMVSKWLEFYLFAVIWHFILIWACYSYINTLHCIVLEHMYIYIYIYIYMRERGKGASLASEH